MRALPRRAVRELLWMVTPLDKAYLSRTTPGPLATSISPGGCDGSWIYVSRPRVPRGRELDDREQPGKRPL